MPRPPRLFVFNGTTACDLIRDMLIAGLRLAFPSMKIKSDFPLPGMDGPWKADTSRGWDYHTACNFVSDDFDEPDLILANESTLDGLYGAEHLRPRLAELLEPYRGRIVSFNGADFAHRNENPVLREHAALRFVSQLPTDWTDPRLRPLPVGVRPDRLPELDLPRTVRVMFGGTYMRGHGGRWELMQDAMEQGLIDLLMQGQTGVVYFDAVASSQAAIAIGCAGNDPTAGLNTKHIETVCAGAACLSFPPGVVLHDAPVEGREWFSFRTGAELVELCKRVRAGDIRPLPADRVRELREAHSLQARARYFVQEVNALGLL